MESGFCLDKEVVKALESPTEPPSLRTVRVKPVELHVVREGVKEGRRVRKGI